MLFHEIYGSYYHAVAAILEKAVHGDLTKEEMYAIAGEVASGEGSLRIPEGMGGGKSDGKWRLLRQDFSTPLEKEPSMPLTMLERRWMKTLLLDPRIRLFSPDTAGLEDIDPLFTPDMVVYYDRYSDGDNYQDPGYIERFGVILKALRENRSLHIRFETRRGTQLELAVSPHYLEYSEKDDRFRLVSAGQGKRWTINLSRITWCTLADSAGQEPLPPEQKDTVEFELEDRRNALDRVLLHFSHLEKETKKLDENRYYVTLKYDRQDEMEILIRVLSFGPVITVLGPESFVSLVRERIEKQARLSGISHAGA